MSGSVRYYGWLWNGGYYPNRLGNRQKEQEHHLFYLDTLWTEGSKTEHTFTHLFSTGRCHSECQHHTDPSGLPVCYLITLLISRQTKLRGSFVFSSFLSRILIAPCSCQTPPPGNRRCSGPPGPGPSLRSPASCRWRRSVTVWGINDQSWVHKETGKWRKWLFFECMRLLLR